MKRVEIVPKRIKNDKDGLWAYLSSPEMQPVVQTKQGPKEVNHRLNKYAKESFDKMKAEAKNRGGVNLIILSGKSASDRTKEDANANCAGKSRFAVACFPNSHNLGLAVDLYNVPGKEREIL